MINCNLGAISFGQSQFPESKKGPRQSESWIRFTSGFVMETPAALGKASMVGMKLPW